MDEDDKRDLLKALKARRLQNKQSAYEWRVHVHKPVEEVLDIVQNRHNPLWKPPKPEPYTVTANFATIEEAQEYACMVRLKGKVCSINNNWTGEVVDE
jgi:hypothetical protein